MSIKTNFPISRPSLNLDFANTKVLDPRVTFGRASTSTYYDGKTTVKAEENLLTYSQDFESSGWQKYNTSITANAITAPDGTSTADKAIASATTSSHILYQPAGTNGVQQVFSIYAKVAEYTNLQVCLNGSGLANATFDLAAVTATNIVGTSVSIIDVGGGWRRCIVIFTPGSNLALGIQGFPTGATASNYGNTYTGDGTSGIYIWGAQLEQRSQATAYTPTTSSPITNYLPVLQTALSNVPRFDHDPITGESKGLLIEEQRTNLLSASQDFEAPVWVKSNATVNANCVVAPDGTTTADKLVEGSATSYHYAQTAGITVTSGVPYTVSLYVKDSGRSFIQLGFSGAGNLSTTFNTALGTVTSTGAGASSASITPVGNGWYRISVTGTSTSTVGQFQIFLTNSGTGAASYTGDGTSGIYIWGAQLEAGAFATSYVATPISFTSRASTATYRGSNGLIQTAAINTARYEPNSSGGSNLLLESAATNLLTRTEMFGGSPWNTYFSSFSQDAAVAPDGSITADTLSGDGTVNFHSANQPTATTATNFVGSIYCKQATSRYAFLQVRDGSGNNGGSCVFDLQNGTYAGKTSDGTGTVGEATITPASNGFFRVTLAVSFASSTASFRFGITNSATAINSYASTDSIYLWGAQLETGSVATSYVPSVETFTSRASTATYYGSNGLIQTAASNVARINYNPLNLSVPGKLLLEPAATNLLTYSEQFDNAAWTKTGATVTANAVTAPDGTLTADKLIEDSSTGFHYVVGLTSTSANSSYSGSVYVKAAERTRVCVQIAGASWLSGSSAYVDLTNGSMVSGAPSAGTYSVSSVGNGWYRITWTATTDATATTRGILISTVSGTTNSYTGDGTSGIYIWGAQLEQGTGASSYIPTTTAQVTRAADVSTSAQGTRAADVYSAPTVTRSADVASMTGTNFSSWYNSAEGSFYANTDASFGNRVQAGVIFNAVADSNNSHHFAYRAAGFDNYTIQSRISGVNQFSPVDGGDPNWSNDKVAYGFSTSGGVFISNGSTVTTSSSNLGSIAATAAYLGSSSGTNSFLNGHLKRLAYYPKRLSNTELQGITA